MTKSGRKFTGLFLGAVAVAIFTFKFPDLDIRLLGIGRHRYYLFHSAIIPLVGVWVYGKIRRFRIIGFIAAVLATGFLAGVGVHLVTDVFQSTKIYFPFIGSLVKGTSIDDRLWEGGNALVCFGSAWKVGKRQITHHGSTLYLEDTSL